MVQENQALLSNNNSGIMTVQSVQQTDPTKQIYCTEKRSFSHTKTGYVNTILRPLQQIQHAGLQTQMQAARVPLNQPIRVNELSSRTNSKGSKVNFMRLTDLASVFWILCKACTAFELDILQ